jgi:hypothetical protein
MVVPFTLASRYGVGVARKQPISGASRRVEPLMDPAAAVAGSAAPTCPVARLRLSYHKVSKYLGFTGAAGWTADVRAE